MSHLLPATLQLLTCSSPSQPDAVCGLQSAGHQMFPLQGRASAATPSSWQDALVREASDSGWVALELVENEQVLRVWNHSAALTSLRSGTPVALHGRYHLLAYGDQRFNVLVADE